MDSDVPAWASKAARQVYGRLIRGPQFEKTLDSHIGIMRQHDEEKIRGAARIITQCRREAL